MRQTRVLKVNKKVLLRRQSISGRQLNILDSFILQVPEATAKELKAERISCTFRDTIAVKGKGSMRTHYVDLTEDQYLVEMSPIDM